MSDRGVARLLELCQEALAREGSERDAFLADACAGDRELRRAVEELLAGQVDTGGFLNDPAWSPPERLPAGARLGPYEIESFIGAGGMGVVYKARDTRLDRTVAIKVLAPAGASTVERLARFEREARTIAGLNHPHICTLHDVGTHDGSMFLVMEYIAGETLAARLRRGPLPLPQALNVAAQVADAMAAAHRQGVSHRDLKPGNVMLTRRSGAGSGSIDAKLLDFGLAKLRPSEPAVTPAGTSAMATREPDTGTGRIVGTVPYMAPEQLQGKEADARSDIFSFGATLHEMLTGSRAFDGDSHASVIAAILRSDPPSPSSLQPLTPPAVDRVVRKCLSKDPDERWQSAGDLADELRWLAAGSGSAPAIPTVQRRRRRSRLVASALLLCTAAAAALALNAFLAGPRVRVRLFDVRPADALSGASPYDRTVNRPSHTAIVVSRDGSKIFFSAVKGDIVQIYARSLDREQATPIPGTEGGESPFLSPDERWLGFLAGTTWRKVLVDGGVPVDIIQRPAPAGAVWAADGRILFGSQAGAVFQVDASGHASDVTTLRREAGEFAHMSPQLLPDGSLIFTSVSGSGLAGSKIMVQQAASGRVSTLIEGAADARYAPTGHLIYSRAGKLCARPFDVRRLLMTGSEAGVEDDVMQSLNDPGGVAETGASQVAISQSGTLAFVRGGVFRDPKNVLAWLGRDGTMTPLPVEGHGYAGVRLSPDGRRAVAFTMGSLDPSLWVYDFERKTTARVPAGIGAAWPLWAPDGKGLFFLGLAGSAGGSSMFRLALDRPEQADSLKRLGWPACWANGGGDLVYVERGERTAADIWALPLAAHGEAYPLVRTSANETCPAVSPDGAWLAYTSNESGRNEVYVRRYRGGEAVRVSSNGGRAPAWRRDGRELVFVGIGRSDVPLSFYSVPVKTGSRFVPGPVTRVFEERGSRSNVTMPPGMVRGYEVAADGRFLVVLKDPPRDAPPKQIEVVENWLDQLEVRVPAAGVR
jgi:serine/threonine-protein kinase